MPLQQSLPTPSNPTGAGITFHGNTTIHRPASKVWEVLVDTASYPSWNTFTPRLELSLPPSSPTPPSPSPHPTTSSPPSPPTPTPTLKVGSLGTLSVYMTGRETKPRAVAIQVSVVDEAKFLLCWEARALPQWLLRGERVMEVRDLGGAGDGGGNGGNGGSCEFRNFETMRGPLAWVVGWWQGKELDAAFQRCAEDLKAFVEGG